MSVRDLDKFQQLVYGDAALLAALCRAETLSDLFAAVIAAACERGLDVSEDDLRAVVNANRRAWMERELDQ
jgi:hypothetical protein